MGGLGGLGVGVGNIVVGEGPDRESLVLLRDTGLVAESDQLVAIFDGLGKILLCAVVLVIKRINIVQQSRIRVLRDEIVEALELRRSVRLSGASLVRVVLRHGVLLRASSAA